MSGSPQPRPLSSCPGGHLCSTRPLAVSGFLVPGSHGVPETEARCLRLRWAALARCRAASLGGMVMERPEADGVQSTRRRAAIAALGTTWVVVAVR